MNKRAQVDKELLVKMIVGVVSFIILCLFVAGLVTLILGWIKTTNCNSSITKSAVDGLPDFRCNVGQVTLSSAGTDAGKLDEKMKREIADMMWDCWKTVGSGNLDPYRDSFEVKWGYDFAYGDNIVDIYLLCDVIKFKDVPGFKGLEFWMTLNKPSGNSIPYYDFVYKKHPTNEEITQLEKQEDTYDTTKDYVVAWKYTAVRTTVAGVDVTLTNQTLVFSPLTELADDVQSPSKYQIIMN